MYQVRVSLVCRSTRLVELMGLTAQLVCSTTAAMLALIAGCAQMEWLKPDTEPATRNQDLARCEQQAQLTASRMFPSEYPWTSSVNAGPSGSASAQMPPPHGARDLTLELDIVTSCMHARGYRLVRAKPGGGH
jgi:hypothetical protein